MSVRTDRGAPGRNGKARPSAEPAPGASAYGEPPRLGVVAPRAPRRRTAVTGLVVGALLATVCMLGFAALLTSSDDRASVLVATRPVAAGQRFTADDVAVVKVAVADGVGSVPAADQSRVVGRVAAFGVPKGGLLTAGHVAVGPAVEAGMAVVGLSLRAGQYPPGLRAGDRVRLVVTAGQGQGQADGGQATALVGEAKVHAVTATEAGQGAAVSVVIRDTDAVKVTAAAASGAVGLALLGGAA